MPYLRVLGGAVLEVDAGVVSGPAGRRHPLAVLALLAIAPARALSRGKLVGLLWPESPEKTARNRLNTCLHHIRSTLGKEVVVSAGDDVRLDGETLGCDAWEFQGALESEDYERAVGAYGGPFLDGFRLGGHSTAFEKRVDQERRRFRRRYLEALEALAEAAERRGEPEVSARWWGERAGQDPYDSRVARRLVEALEAAGNRAAALRAARVHAQLLERELGAAPGADLEELVRVLETRPQRAESGGAAEPGERALSRTGAESGRSAEPEQAAAAGGAAETGRTPQSETRSRLPSSGRSANPRAPLAVAVAVSLVAAAAFALFYFLGAAGFGSASAVGTEERSVAVLPFETIGEEEASPFARGVHAGLLTRLSKLPTLAVISDASVRLLERSDRPLPEAAAALGVDWIVQADVQEVDREVQVNARLVDARRDRQVWAETYRTDLAAGGLFEIQAEIVRQIATALEIRLSPEEARRVAAVPTRNLAAYELYLQGEALSELPSHDPSRLERRSSLYRRALELDSTFADAWARLAHSYIVRAWVGEDPHVWADSAIMAANRALRFDPTSAEAYVQLGNAYATRSRDLEPFLEAYRRALDLEPSHFAAANNMASFLYLRGRLAEALRALDRAYRLSPGDPSHLRSLSFYNSELGRDDVANGWLALARDAGLTRAEFDIELFHRGRMEHARALLPSMAEVLPPISLLRRQAALALYEGEWREARRLYRSIAPDVMGGAAIFQGLLHDDLARAFTLDRIGDEEEARAIAREVMAENEPLTDRPEYHYPLRLAGAALLLGDEEGALDWLERSVEAGYRDHRTLRTLPHIQPLRAHPRFESLAARIDSLVAVERQRVEAEGWGMVSARSMARP